MMHPETVLLLLIMFTLCGCMAFDFYLSSQPVAQKTVQIGKIVLYGLFSLCFLWPFFGFAVYVAAPEYKIIVGTWGTVFFFERVFNMLAFVSGCLLGVLGYRLGTEHKVGDRILLGFKILGLVVLLLLSNVTCWVLDEGKYYSFSSPDKAHTIVVHEINAYKIGTVTVYERVNPFLVRMRGSAQTYKNRPVEAGNYAVVWQENSVTFSFDDGQGGQKSVFFAFD